MRGRRRLPVAGPRRRIVVAAELGAKRLGVPRAHGTGRRVADVLAANSRMLERARRLNCAERANSDGTRFIEHPRRAPRPVEPPAPGPARPG